MKIQYMCETCKSVYDTPEEALACEARTEKPLFKIGDIVTARAGFGWFDGDKRWIENFDKLGMYINPGVMPGMKHRGSNCFGSCCTYQYYYVITSIGSKPIDPHEIAYDLATLAMSGKSGYMGGWTTHNGSHYIPKLVKHPPEFVVNSSKRLIGMKFSTLL